MIAKYKLSDAILIETNLLEFRMASEKSLSIFSHEALLEHHIRTGKKTTYNVDIQRSHQRSPSWRWSWYTVSFLSQDSYMIAKLWPHACVECAYLLALLIVPWLTGLAVNWVSPSFILIVWDGSQCMVCFIWGLSSDFWFTSWICILCSQKACGAPRPCDWDTIEILALLELGMVFLSIGATDFHFFFQMPLLFLSA